MKKIFMLWLSVFMFAGMISFLPANAVTVLPADSQSPQPGCTFLGIEGKYITQIQESIDLINQIRLEACKEGVTNPGTGQPLTEEDYVPIEWSADLEYIARIRAAESGMTMDHARTNGESIWFSGPNGVSSHAEVIAWNYGETMTSGIYQWYAEKNDWVNKTGGVTGHYTSMINPGNRYVGLGTFCSGVTRYYNTTVGEFCGSLDNPDTSRGSSTGNIIHILEVKNENIISYNISGSDSLFITAAVSFDDYWGGSLITENLTLAGASAENVQWSSSNNDIVSVSNGILKAKSCGEAVITAQIPNGASATKSVFYEHSYETTTVAATCKDEGRIVKKCKICGNTETQIIPKTNQHSYETETVAATCKDEGRIVKKCKICGAADTQIIPKTNQHSFGQWVTTKAPTEKTDGLKTRTCLVCKLTETQALHFQPQDKNTSGDEESTATSGDGTSTATSGDSASTATSGDGTSTTATGDNASTATSGDDASTAATGDSASTATSGDNASTAATGDSASTATSGDDASTSMSGDGTSSLSPNDEMPDEELYGTSVPDTSNNNRWVWMLIVIILGVLFAGAVVLFALLYRKRKRK